MIYKLQTKDKEEFYMAYHGQDLYFALHDLDQWLRSEVKHNNRNELQEVRDVLHECMDVWGVDFDHVS